MAYKISVDTGGTFTDAIVRDADGRLTIGKALTTHGRIFEGVRGAIAAAAGDMGLDTEALLAGASLLVYGTTRSTNAIVTKNVAKTAFVTTQGFPEILVLKEGGKFNPHDFTKDYAEPFIPRRHTFELAGRISAEGEELAAFDEAQARSLIERLRDENFEAVAVCLLWSVANPVHEKAFGSLLAEMLPGVPFTLSHQLVPVVREYRRASATAIDASLKPLMQHHLRELETDLRTAGFEGMLLVSTAAGGCAHVAEMIERPIYTIGSGPAMAPIAGRAYSAIEALGDNVIICDTGGTTFDVGLVRDGRVAFSRDTWLGGHYTGDLLGISTVDMRSIGAGGGSIAWIDEGGLLRVGPQSAGSEPGPACYGRGGKAPTVSDAAVVLGYFDPDYFLGGRMKLDAQAAWDAVATVATPLGCSVPEAAFRVMSLASELMVRAIEDVTVSEGLNPRESTIAAGGGAAGVNIMAIAAELGCREVILPKVASALSAAGMQYADIVAEATASLVTSSDRFDAAVVDDLLGALQSRLDAFAARLPGDTGAGLHTEFVAEARYEGQVWELDTPIPQVPVAKEDGLGQLVEAFHRVHERIFAVRDEGSAVEVVNWKARLTVPLGEQPGAVPPIAHVPHDRPAHGRACFFGGAEPMTTPIYKPADLVPGIVIEGPAIIEEPTTTLVVNPGTSVTISGAGNYLLSIGQGA